MAYASCYIYARCPKCYQRVNAVRIGGVVTLKTHLEEHTTARCEGSNLTLTTSPAPTEAAS